MELISLIHRPTNDWALDYIKTLAQAFISSMAGFCGSHPALDLNQKQNLDQVAISFVNHASFLIQAAGYNILTDPVWSERVSPTGELSG